MTEQDLIDYFKNEIDLNIDFNNGQLSLNSGSFPENLDVSKFTKIFAEKLKNSALIKEISEISEQLILESCYPFYLYVKLIGSAKEKKLEVHYFKKDFYQSLRKRKNPIYFKKFDIKFGRDDRNNITKFFENKNKNLKFKNYKKDLPDLYYVSLKIENSNQFLIEFEQIKKNINDIISFIEHDKKIEFAFEL